MNTSLPPEHLSFTHQIRAAPTAAIVMAAAGANTSLSPESSGALRVEWETQTTAAVSGAGGR